MIDNHREIGSILVLLYKCALDQQTNPAREQIYKTMSVLWSGNELYKIVSPPLAPSVLNSLSLLLVRYVTSDHLPVHILCHRPPCAVSAPSFLLPSLQLDHYPPRSNCCSSVHLNLSKLSLKKFSKILILVKE